MKDIEQSLLVQRAVEDLLIDCDIRHVPCVRDRATGVPVSSRLRFLPPARLREVGGVYHALQVGRATICAGETNSQKVIEAVRVHLDTVLSTFTVVYVTVVDAAELAPVARVALPFVLHCAITDGTLTHFDGLYIRTPQELTSSPAVIWLDTASASAP